MDTSAASDGDERWSLHRLRTFVGHQVAIDTDTGHMEGTLLSCTSRSAWIVSDDVDHVVALPHLRLVHDLS